MKIYIETKNRVVHKIKKNEDRSKTDTLGKVIEIEESEGLNFDRELFCVIDISSHGKEIQAFGFSTLEESHKFFKARAFHKFSNWSDYSPYDISEILEQGFEKTGDGSLCLSSI